MILQTYFVFDLGGRVLPHGDDEVRLEQVVPRLQRLLEHGRRHEGDQPRGVGEEDDERVHAPQGEDQDVRPAPRLEVLVHAWEHR